MTRRIIRRISKMKFMFGRAALAITILSACAPNTGGAEIPHPPFTAERFQEFETGPVLECLNEEVSKGDKAIIRLRNMRPGATIEAIEVFNEETKKLFRQMNDCYISAQIKWGASRPLSADQFGKMRDSILERCDKPLEKRAAAWRPSREHPTELQLEQALAEMSKEFGDRVRIQNQCYRDVQTEWGFR
jgi:hypothetical protein